MSYCACITGCIYHISSAVLKQIKPRSLSTVLGSSQLKKYLKTKVPQKGISAPKLRTTTVEKWISGNSFDVPPTGLLRELRERENSPCVLIPMLSSQNVRTILTTVSQVKIIISRKSSLQKTLSPSRLSLKLDKL